MTLMTYNEILTYICDFFDSLISPKQIARTNTNIIYLVFKAISKGLEVINNVCVTLSNKFDPKSCSDEDLTSSADMVGTERYSGSASGLRITITNNGAVSAVLKAGIYTYALDDDTKFEFEVMSDTTIAASSYISFIAMSEEIGSYPVTEQTDITVESVQPIPSDFTFSCGNNSALLGTTEETDLEFRKRICSKTDRQNALVELEDEIKNLPYIFDCKIKFNDTVAEEEYDGITIPAFTALICYSGEIKKELAEKVCSKIICPTLQTVNFTPFNKTQYGVEIIYKINNTYADDYDNQNEIRSALFNRFVSEVHVDYVKEDDVYNLIEELGISGIELLGVNLKYNGNNVNYIEVPKTRIPELTQVIFTQE